MKHQRPVEHQVFGAQEAQSVLDQIKPAKWFESAVSDNNVDELHENASFINLETAKRLMQDAHVLGVRSAWNSLRSYAQRYLAAQHDAIWGGRRAD